MSRESYDEPIPPPSAFAEQVLALRQNVGESMEAEKGRWSGGVKDKKVQDKMRYIEWKGG